MNGTSGYRPGMEFAIEGMNRGQLLCALAAALTTLDPSTSLVSIDVQDNMFARNELHIEWSWGVGVQRMCCRQVFSFEMLCAFRGGSVLEYIVFKFAAAHKDSNLSRAMSAATKTLSAVGYR